jgi:outer membrane lipoprotein carrier protein
MPHALLVAIALLAGAPPAETSAVVSGLQVWLDGTSSLDMRFRQSLVSRALGTTGDESGRVYLERPGKLRWDYLEPDRKVALLIGDRTELYLEDDRQLVRGRVSPEQGLFPRLLAGRDRLVDLFDATLAATPAAAGNGSYRLKLTAKESSGAVTQVTLTLRPKTFSIEAAEILDESGNETTYVFSDVRRNRKLPGGTFAFEPPPGTEVIDESPSAPRP